MFRSLGLVPAGLMLLLTGFAAFAHGESCHLLLNNSPSIKSRWEAAYYQSEQREEDKNVFSWSEDILKHELPIEDLKMLFGAGPENWPVYLGTTKHGEILLSRGNQLERQIYLTVMRGVSADENSETGNSENLIWMLLKKVSSWRTGDYGPDQEKLDPEKKVPRIYTRIGSNQLTRSWAVSTVIFYSPLSRGYGGQMVLLQEAVDFTNDLLQ